MSGKKSKPGKAKSSKRIPKSYILAVGIVVIICIVIVAGFVIIKQGATAANTSANTTPFNQAGALYSKSVDLANAGNYQDALTAANEALALNISSLIPIIQSNRAGILVELGRYNDAIDAANVAINATGNLTNLRAIAYYNKANALEDLGETAAANAAYANASALNPALKHP
ncbi:tetratricopeptide repeat protein [Methanoregula sp.]|jgi:tetratricopeptide (TPR) repeat protein|uniref:tetratricopeptide repeat protein n=1 Tax=Methanoregula sp. TaxID=2052170 RepID=UPI003C196732